MGKYEPLTRHLRRLDRDSWEADFAEIERILGFPLPASAQRYQAWWANQSGGGHSQTHGWQDAGWETRHVNPQRRRVRFERAKRLDRTAEPRQPRPADNESLWRRAAEISGIEDRDTLLQAALTAFIQKEAARQLAAMGGTMPNLQLPPRERSAS